jgi:hypothetical protein
VAEAEAILEVIAQRTRPSRQFPAGNLPDNFSYRFEDADGRQSQLQVLDWETG